MDGRKLSDHGLSGTCICLILEAAMVASFAAEAPHGRPANGVAATYSFVRLQLG